MTESKVLRKSTSLITSHHHILHDAVEALKTLDWRKFELLTLRRDRPSRIKRSDLDPIAFLIGSRDINDATLDLRRSVFSEKIADFIGNGLCLEFRTSRDEHFTFSFIVSLNVTDRTSGQWNVLQRS